MTTNKVIPSWKKSDKADRGKEAERRADKYLALWASGHANREYNRLVDTKAAGRIIKAAKADFEFYCAPTNAQYNFFGLLEVKETEHEYRLARPKISQLPSLTKRAKCGGSCYVLIFHSTIESWRCIPVRWLIENGDKGSWNLSEFVAYPSPGEALRSCSAHWAL